MTVLESRRSNKCPSGFCSSPKLLQVPQTRNFRSGLQHRLVQARVSLRLSSQCESGSQKGPVKWRGRVETNSLSLHQRATLRPSRDWVRGVTCARVSGDVRREKGVDGPNEKKRALVFCTIKRRLAAAQEAPDFYAPIDRSGALRAKKVKRVFFSPGFWCGGPSPGWNGVGCRDGFRRRLFDGERGSLCPGPRRSGCRRSVFRVFGFVRRVRVFAEGRVVETVKCARFSRSAFAEM